MLQHNSFFSFLSSMLALFSFCWHCRRLYSVHVRMYFVSINQKNDQTFVQYKPCIALHHFGGTIPAHSHQRTDRSPVLTTTVVSDHQCLSPRQQTMHAPCGLQQFNPPQSASVKVSAAPLRLLFRILPFAVQPPLIASLDAAQETQRHYGMVSAYMHMCRRHQPAGTVCCEENLLAAAPCPQKPHVCVSNHSTDSAAQHI